MAADAIGDPIRPGVGLFMEGGVEWAAGETRRLLPVFKALFWVTNPVPIKYAANRAGFNAGPTRLPMAPPDDDFRERFDPVMDRYQMDLPV